MNPSSLRHTALAAMPLPIGSPPPAASPATASPAPCSSRRDTRVESFTDSPPLSSQTPMIVVASDDDPYAKTSYVWRLSRHWDARFVNAGPFGHINADSGVADWPYGQYLL
ncbi:MAG: hypothetical protein EOP63_07510, partial [Sphingomonadales bacterium]